MMDRGKGAFFGEAAILLAVSVMLYRIGLASFIFVAPLLLFAIRNGRRAASILIAAGCLAVAVFDTVSTGLPSDKEGLALLLINLYIPLSLSAAGIIWLWTGRMGLLARLFATLLPSIILSGSLAAFIGADRALSDALLELFGNAFAVLLSPVVSLVMPGADMAAVAYAAILTVLSLLLPVTLCGICASCFIYETGLHSRESGWEEKVMRFSFPPDAVWGLIVSWALVLLLRFVSMPVLLDIAALNAAGIWLVLYAIEGFSVVFARIRKHWENARSMTVFVIIIVLGSMVPGINLIILIGLPLIGAFETFFDLKKLGAGNEDHS